MRSWALEQLGLEARVIDVRRGFRTGAEEIVLPATELESVLTKVRALTFRGYSESHREDTLVFRRGWSSYQVTQIVGDVFTVYAFDVAACPAARLVPNGLEWAGVALRRPHDGLLMAGPAWRLGQPDSTWSSAHYFFAPIEFADAILKFGEQLRAQCPRVVGPWTLPDEVWFDVRALRVDAKVRLKPSTSDEVSFLFQRSQPRAAECVGGVLIEITGVDEIDEGRK